MSRNSPPRPPGDRGSCRAKLHRVEISYGRLINTEVLRDQIQELKDILERWIHVTANFRDWQLAQWTENGTQ